MVRVIYITSQKHFIPPKRIICKLSDYGKPSKFQINSKYSKFEYCFDDYTGNFTNLLYWDTDIDLNNKTLVQVLHKLSVAISRLEKENITPKSYEPGFVLPVWWFGNMRRSPGSCFTKDMPDEERKPILLLHLLDMYHMLINIHKRNKIFYCYVCL